MRNHIHISFDSDRPLTDSERAAIELDVRVQVEEPTEPTGERAPIQTDNIKISSYTI